MTYIVLSGALNSTHSLTRALLLKWLVSWFWRTMAQNTESRKVVPFWCLHDGEQHLGVQISQKPSKLDLNVQFKTSKLCANKEWRHRSMTSLTSLVVQRRMIAGYFQRPLRNVPYFTAKLLSKMPNHCSRPNCIRVYKRVPTITPSPGAPDLKQFHIIIHTRLRLWQQWLWYSLAVSGLYVPLTIRTMDCSYHRPFVPLIYFVVIVNFFVHMWFKCCYCSWVEFYCKRNIQILASTWLGLRLCSLLTYLSASVQWLASSRVKRVESDHSATWFNSILNARKSAEQTSHVLSRSWA